MRTKHTLMTFIAGAATFLLIGATTNLVHYGEYHGTFIGTFSGPVTGGLTNNQVGPLVVFGSGAKTNAFYMTAAGEVFSNAVGTVTIAGGTVTAKYITGQGASAPTITLATTFTNGSYVLNASSNSMAYTVTAGSVDTTLPGNTYLWTNTFATAYASPPTVIGPCFVGGTYMTAALRPIIAEVTTTNFTVMTGTGTFAAQTNSWSFLVFP
jgi:hypothetical protein